MDKVSFSSKENLSKYTMFTEVLPGLGHKGAGGDGGELVHATYGWDI